MRVLAQGEDENPESIRIEIFSELDYFFLYEHVCYEDDYIDMKCG